MTGWRKRQVMEMAREAGWDAHHAEFDPRIERFAELVREDATAEANARANASWAMMCEKMVAIEREACAKVCEDSNTWDLYDPNGFAANLIRTRGQA
jgi:hypothetical protein